MSRSKHQTLKGIIDGKSKSQINEMFEEQHHDAMEWVAKGVIKKNILRERGAAKKSSKNIT
jgi:ribosomal protein S20